MRILEEFEETGSISEKIEAACEIANKQIGDEFFDVSDMKVRIPKNFIPDIRPTLERIDSNYIPRKTWFGGENEKNRFSVTSISDNDKIEFCHFNKLSLNQETDDHDKFEKEGIIANVVSVPCYDLFVEQEQSYIDQVIDKNTKVYAVEAARGLEYYRFADVVFGMDTFGASGPADKLFEEFGFTIDKLKEKIVADFKK